MIAIYLNTQRIELQKPCSLIDILHNHIDGNFAIAVNRKFIAKAHYANYILQDGDQIEMITPMQGG